MTAMLLQESSRFATDLARIRQTIHSHPELAFEEVLTSDLVAAELASYGCAVHRGIGGTGVVGELRAGSSHRSIGIRADMDALPIDEENDLPYRSTIRGKMHACGHDGHTTMLLGAARQLAATRRFDGVVYFIFQPAEEGRGGASAMIDDGLFDRFPCDSVFGLHNIAGLPTGTLSVRDDAMMAGAATFGVTVHGRGGHGARPENAVDPVAIAGQLIVALQTIISRNVRAFDTAVVSITQVAAGQIANVIPATATLGGTARAFSDTTMALVEERMRAICGQVAAAFGGSADVSFDVNFPPLINDPVEAGILRNVAVELVGESRVLNPGIQRMASEDFAFMLQKRPGAFLFIGNGAEPGWSEIHTSRYNFNDQILPVGAALWTALAERKLSVAPQS